MLFEIHTVLKQGPFCGADDSLGTRYVWNLERLFWRLPRINGWSSRPTVLTLAQSSQSPITRCLIITSHRLVQICSREPGPDREYKENDLGTLT